MRVRLPVKAGPHDVSAAFLEHLPVEDTVRLQAFLRSSADNFDWSGRPHIQSLTITGPFNATGAGDTPTGGASSSAISRRRRLRRHESCRALARRAYRQPVTDADIAPV